jgi:hypothetical protein
MVFSHPKVKCVPHLLILSDTDFEDLSTFPKQINEILEDLTLHLRNIVSDHLIFSSEPTAPIVMTKTYQMVKILVIDSRRQREPISMICIIQRIKRGESVFASFDH